MLVYFTTQAALAEPKPAQYKASCAGQNSQFYNIVAWLGLRAEG